MAHAQGGARGVPSFQERGGRDRPCAPLAFAGLSSAAACPCVLAGHVRAATLNQCLIPMLFIQSCERAQHSTFEIIKSWVHFRTCLPSLWGAGLGGGWIWGRMVCALLWSLRVRSSNGLLNLGCSVHYPLPLMGLETQKFWPYFFLRLYFNDCCMESVWYCI